ncbi:MULTISPECIES: hypothetical protein [unclassified Mycoplasma]|uniref:hypothetical protein n=1 Tax=unclassified Mycoplasma TaxID=2683645 RepID=UPI00211C3F9A|nr:MULTISPECIES: hypothetical protein [unclassified Mycoplasma]UUM19674.1 hypothetical protein NPA11_02800 [Mycoplasma sp. 1578d]UUM24657.1 hypothetical protein NPA12_03095 [Mycoplasma sp. 3686d]
MIKKFINQNKHEINDWLIQIQQIVNKLSDLKKINILLEKWMKFYKYTLNFLKKH